MSNSAIGAFLAFVDVEIEDCKDEKYRLKEKRTRLEGLRAALMAAQTEPSPAPASFSSSSSSSSEPKSSSKKNDKKRKTDESVGSDEATTATTTKKQKVKAKKEKKDPNKPSRAPSAYNFFMKKEGAAHKLAHPETEQKEIMGVVGAAWKVLSEEDKQPFIKQAEAAKVVATAAMEAYKEGMASAAAAPSAADDSDSDSV